jgi:Na+/H+ antiporter NhaD/arsenite permease-like protein
VVFFIFLVANIGGSLTPRGDPPLFLGFLAGVPFFWTLTHLITPMLTLSAILLVLYFLLDSHLYAKEGKPRQPGEKPDEKLRVEGAVNFLFLACIVGAVLVSGTWQSDVQFDVYHVVITLPNMARDILLLAIAYASLKATGKETREGNDFNWEPILEVAKLFLGIFISMIPALAILRAGTGGALASVIQMVTSPEGYPVDAMYFWLSGALSSFLDNAPTYLVFFNTAGGDAEALTTTLASTLTAVSCGAVFMGANTYIGNAPNFMVRSIAENQGVPMPSFFGYMAWSVGILIPCFIILTFLYF